MRSKAQVIGIALADIHLSQKAPLCRDEEPDWYQAMLRPLREVEKLRLKYKVPVFCSGDIFHKWNSTPELINFALENLPPMYAIPGQHDLPQHNYSDIKKSAYWSLVAGGKIINVEPAVPHWSGLHGDGITDWNPRIIRITGFPWSIDFRENSYYESEYQGQINIALVHRYVWEEKTILIDEKHNHISVCHKKLQGFDFSLFGDNHMGFITDSEDPLAVNCGGLMRRSTIQKDYKPFVTLLFSDGTAEPHFLDISKEKIRETTVEAELIDNFDLSAFVEQIEHLEEYTIDFEETVRRYLTENKTSEDIASKILKAMEE